MISWWIDRGALSEGASDAFSTLDSVFALEGELVAKDPLSRVLKVDIGSKCFYVKRYIGNGKTRRRRWFGLRQWLVMPRLQTEWTNLLRFQQWGIPTAKLVAYGMERRFGGFRRGALITEEIPSTTDLATMSLRNDPRLKNHQWVANVSQQIARMTRTMHHHGFAHNDLKWRNLLITEGAEPSVFLIDCPCGCFWRSPFLQYRTIKDLACLDKVAKYHLTRTQRLRFYLDYLEQPRLTASNKKQLRKIIHFFDGRE